MDGFLRLAVIFKRLLFCGAVGLSRFRHSSSPSGRRHARLSAQLCSLLEKAQTRRISSCRYAALQPVQAGHDHFVVATSTLLCSLKPVAEKLCAIEPVGPLMQALEEAINAAAPFLGGGTAKEVSLA